MRHILLSFGMIAALSACGDPLRDVARLSDVNVADGAATATQTASEARNTGGGLFGRLLNRQPDDPTNAAVQAALAEAGAPLGEDADPIILDAAPEPERRGLFGGLFGNRTATQAEPELDVTEIIEEPTASDVVAAAVPASALAQAEDTPSPRRGLAGLFRRTPDQPPLPRTGPDATDVSAGTVMPFGQIGRVCGLRANELGTPIDRAATFRIYDTIPNSTAPRPFYITGFDDNCARTFTGAVVVTGDAETHEFVRYRPSNERIPYSTTDNAYEALKASVCRVGRGQPCGERLARMESVRFQPSGRRFWCTTAKSSRCRLRTPSNFAVI